jgi:hypothetical protein
MLRKLIKYTHLAKASPLRTIRNQSFSKQERPRKQKVTEEEFELGFPIFRALFPNQEYSIQLSQQQAAFFKSITKQKKVLALFPRACEQNELAINQLAV